MNHIKEICKDPAKVQQKLQGKQFLLGKYFTIKSNCNRCKKDKKFQKSKRQKFLEIQHQLNEEQIKEMKEVKKTNPDQIIHSQLEKESPVIQVNKMIDEKQQKKEADMSKTSVSSIDYKYFLPLHRLWQSYMSDLLGNEKNQQSTCLKLLRGDFVGAEIQVIYSKVQSYIGQRGIVIKETLRSFVIVKHLAQNQVNVKKNIISVLKNQIIFRLQCGDRNFVVNGNTLVYRPSDRSKHKFKFRIGEKLNLNFLANFIQE